MTGRDYLKIPELEKIFDTAYDAGARVHTNSWGNVGGIYGQLSMDVDRYLHQHQDFFVLFAGGNEGYSGLRSVIAPGNAKNCLTVGATQLRTVAQDERLDDKVARVLTSYSTSCVQYSCVFPPVCHPLTYPHLLFLPSVLPPGLLQLHRPHQRRADQARCSGPWGFPAVGLVGGPFPLAAGPVDVPGRLGGWVLLRCAPDEWD